MSDSLKRSIAPFFSDETVVEHIEHFASVPRLTIYAGAGTTKDRVGLGWLDAVTALVPPEVKEPGLRGLGEHLKVFAKQHAPPSVVATVVSNAYRETFGSDVAAEKIRTRLKDLLYNESHWQGGRLLPNIANLIVNRYLAGLRTCVVTTNYDDYLYCDLRRAVDEALAQGSELPDVIVTTRLTKKTTRTIPGSNRLEIFYVHGIVPNTSSVSAEDTELVFGERDYLDSEERVMRVLRRAFAPENSVLILGSSLTDPPMVNALMQTKANEPGVTQRTALVALQSPEWDVGDVVIHQQLMNHRLDEFGVKALYPDFFGQVGQFVNEVSLLAEVGPEVEAQSATYGQRLAQWWRDWSNGKADGLLRQNKLDSEWQTAHHDLLAGLVEQARPHFGGAKAVIKAESWIRWDPRSQNRRLKLWASSSAKYTDLAAMRDDEIQRGSQYVSVRTFCDGHPREERRLDEAGNAQLSGRWDSYLAVPIVLGQYGNMPVAVITIACLNGQTPTKAQDRDGLITLMNGCGVAIATPAHP